MSENKTPTKNTPQDSELVANFKKGDLIYGLNDIANGKPGARNIYMKILERTCGYYITADRLNNLLIFKIKNLPLPIKKRKNPQGLTPEVQEYWDYLMAFKHRETAPIYNFTLMQKEHEDYIKIHMCKAAILREGITIHFCLDDISIERTASRIHFFQENKSYTEEKKFTTAELRFIYKYRDQLPPNKVRFYSEGKEVNAPWTNPEWAKNYFTKSYISNAVNMMNKAYQQGKAETAAQAALPKANFSKGRNFALLKGITQVALDSPEKHLGHGSESDEDTNESIMPRALNFNT